MSITLDHIGLPVRNLDETIEFYSHILGLTVAEKRIDRGFEYAQIKISDTAAFAVWEVPEEEVGL